MSVAPPYTLRRLTLPLPADWGTPAPEVFDHPLDAESLTRFLSQPGQLLLLAYVGPIIVGQLTAYVCTHPDHRPPSIFIDELGVTPSHQRQGVATALLQELMKGMPETGAQVAWVLAEPHNHPARALYARLATRQETAQMYTLTPTQQSTPQP